MNTPPPPALTARRLAAVSYARVSTKEQAERDGDPDGYSLPAQREANRRKAESLGADIVEEFVDRGESARSADRPELQRMLQFITEHQVDFVVVHRSTVWHAIAPTTSLSTWRSRRRVLAWFP